MSRVKVVWSLLNLPCEGVTRLASESRDCELTRLEWFVLRSHLIYCSVCRRYARQIERVRRAVRRLFSRLEDGQDFPGPPLADDVRERIKRSLRQN